MNKPEIKELSGEVFSQRRFDYTAMTECQAEVSMPDYYPEVRRVVASFAEALPDSKFLSEGKLEFGGTVSFSVLYIGDDGSLCCVPYSGEYSDSIKLPGEVEGGAAVKIIAAAENLQCRVTAPRKLLLKTRVKTSVISDSREYYECTVKSSSGEPCRRDTTESLLKKEKTVFERWASTTGSCSGTIPDTGEIKPVMCLGSINIVSAIPVRDAVTVTGSAEICCIVLNENGVYSTVHGSIPFEETVAADGVRETDAAAATGRAAAVSVSSDGGVTGAEAEYDIDVTVCRNSELTVTDDMYSTAAVLDTVRTEYEPISLLSCHNGQLTVSGEIKKTGKSGGDDYIITAFAESTFDKAEAKSGKLTVTGECKVKVYIASGGDVLCEEGSFPVKYETPAKDSAENGEILWDCRASVINIEAKDAGDRINVTAELCIMAEAVKKYKTSPVTEARFTSERTDGRSGCTIKLCRPEAGESIWSIAKKHHASMPELERINGVTRDGVSDGKPIIIK